MKIRSQQDFWAGIMFTAIGAGFAGIATTYNMGTAAKMGPGYFPFWLGLLMAILGLIVTFKSLSLRKAQDKIASVDVKSILLVLGGVCVFGLLLRPAGLVVAMLALIFISSFASHDFGWKGTVITAAILVVLCLSVFVYGLNLQFPVLPAFLTK
ncbi:MAG: tripartite tricarboxylate transporter TctB family protein [Burkholderiaceae bacterium]